MGDGHSASDSDVPLEDDVALLETQLMAALHSKDRLLARELLERMGRIHLQRHGGEPDDKRPEQ